MAYDNVGGTYTASDVSRDLIPVVIDHLAEEDPKAVFVTLASEAGLKAITFKQYANAINRVAFWLEREVGTTTQNEGLAYFGTGGGDVGYAILLVAAVKAGCHMLFNSPRNSVDAHANLFALQNCSTVILPDPQPPYVAALLDVYPMRRLQLPTLAELFDVETPRYEYLKTFEEARRHPFVSLHTSGSTGLPKPVTWTLGAAAVAANAYQTPSPDGTTPMTQVYREDVVLSAMPMFHAAGMIINILGPVYCRHRVALPPPGPLLGADAAVSLIKSTKAKMAMLPPSTLDEIGKRPPLLETMADLKYVLAAGGVVTKAAGDAITTKTKILNILGTTEFGAFSQKDIDAEDWLYIQFNPSGGIEFRHYSGDEYELVVVRDKQLECYQTCFEIFPHLQELSSHDLFSQHPTKPDLWLYCGRSDDVIGFLNGEKTNPVSMEGLISSMAEVRNALVIGQGRFEAALLVEPSGPSNLFIDEKAAMIERIWPTIQKANSQCPAHARVSKSHILFTTPEKPMSRASKGTVQRKFTIANYAAEIDALYTDADNLRGREDPVEVDINDLNQSLRKMLISTLGKADLSNEDDFFSRGMDSLQVIQTARLLKLGLEGIGIDADNVAPSTIYTNPTISKLVAAVKALSQESRTTNETAEKNRVERMSLTLEKFSALLKTRDEKPSRQARMPQVVVLTGSTGALGSYLLESLIACGSISKIYCINRSIDSEQQQARVNRPRGLTTEWDSDRVTFLTGDLAKHDLGLGHERYTEISMSADLIMHNAWQVDFNLSLESYEPTHVQGVSNLINLSATSAHNAGIFFISSVGAVMNWLARNSGRVPEEVISDFTVPQAMGYAESKHVSERLLALANTKTHTPISICRVGQIAGPILGMKGMWNKQEWLPSLIISSQYLGIIPEGLGNMQNIDWIPIDVLSSIILELALQSTTGSGPTSRVYHAVNPSITTWAALLPHIQSQMNPAVETVPLATWVKTLRASAGASTTKEDLDANPALKLMDFYAALLSTGSALAVLQTEETEKSSATLRSLGPVKGEWMAQWMRQWRGGWEN